MKNPVSIKVMKRPMLDALKSCHDALLTKLDAANLQGTERDFGNALDDELKRRFPTLSGQTDLHSVGGSQPFSGREKGKLDAYDPISKTGWEYKVVRFPRLKKTPKYDLGQLISDHLRLQRATKLQAGFVVVLMYGPLVEDASSDLAVYRHFHDQMVLERLRCLQRPSAYFKPDKLHDRAACAMGFDNVADIKPAWVEVARFGRLAALAFDSRSSDIKSVPRGVIE